MVTQSKSIVLSMEPDRQHQVEALNSQAVTMARNGQIPLAEQLWSQALLLDPDALPVRANLARLFFQAGRFEDVVELGRQLKPHHACPPALAVLIGQSALRLREPALALRWLTEADRLRPNEPSLQLSLSEALLTCGHVQQAARLLEHLVQRYPDAFEPQLNLALALLESGSLEKAAACYANLLSHWPQNPVVLINAARFYLDYDDRQLARKLIDDLLLLDPHSRGARNLLAELCRHEGDDDQSLQHWQTLLDQDPSDLEVHMPLIFSAMDCGRWSDAAQSLQRAFAHCDGPIPTRLLSAWAELPPSQRQNVFPHWPLEYSTLVHQQQLLHVDDPALSEWINWLRSDPSLIEDRPGKPTVGGLQSHELLNRLDDPLSQSLVAYLSPAVEVYRQQLQDVFPFNLGSRRSLVDSFSGWAVVLRLGGQQLRHTHPEAQISGVLYLRTPTALSNECSKEGHLWFSPNPRWQDPEEGFTVHPKPGLLVLFPSFLPHETIPFFAEGDRICVAFNVN